MKKVNRLRFIAKINGPHASKQTWKYEYDVYLKHWGRKVRIQEIIIKYTEMSIFVIMHKRGVLTATVI